MSTTAEKPNTCLLLAACAAVRRKTSRESYNAADYEVCLEEVGGEFGLPLWPTSSKQEPSKTVLEGVRESLGLTATQTYTLKTYGKPEVEKHQIVTLFVAPVASGETPMGSWKFHNLAQLLENQHQSSYQLQHNHRDMLYSLDQWIRERHTIPFINIDLLFLSNKEGEGIGGLVKAIIENPLHNAKVQPPEDNLVISLNNPVFGARKGLPEVDSNVASNA